MKIHAILIGILFMFGGILYMLIASPLFKIQHERVSVWEENEDTLLGGISLSGKETGEEEVARRLYNDLGSFFEKRTFFTALLGKAHEFVWPNAEVPQEFLDAWYPQFLDIHIEKSYLNRTLAITAERRARIGVWCAQATTTPLMSGGASSASGTVSLSVLETNAPDACVWFDARGNSIGEAPAMAGNLLYKIEDASGAAIGPGAPLLESPLFSALLKIFHVMQESGLYIRSFILRNRALQEIETNVDETFLPKIYFSLRDDPSFILSAIDAVRKIGFDKIAYIDFRVKNRVYYKLR